METYRRISMDREKREGERVCTIDLSIAMSSIEWAWMVWMKDTADDVKYPTIVQGPRVLSTASQFDLLHTNGGGLFGVIPTE